MRIAKRIKGGKAGEEFIFKNVDKRKKPVRVGGILIKGKNAIFEITNLMC